MGPVDGLRTHDEQNPQVALRSEPVKILVSAIP